MIFWSSIRFTLISLSLCLMFGFQISKASQAPVASPKVDASIWSEVDRLISEQKLQAALDKTIEILNQVKTAKPSQPAAANPDELWTQSLVRATQLQLGLHGYENSVRFLMEQEWPKNPDSRALLNLYYAAALMQYQSSYGWEIGQREKNVLDTQKSKEKIDLKSWTTEQIGQAIGKAFDEAMAEATALNHPMPEFYTQFFQKNNFPPGVRPTLRDTIVYLAVQHLANSVYWSPQQSNEIYKLPLMKLAQALPMKRIAARDDSVHPLVRLASWLAEHREFHVQQNRPEAALEVHYELLARLHESTTDERDRAAFRNQLREIQNKNRHLSWWARGQAHLADFIIAENRPGRLIEAREEALKGMKANPGTPGGEMCRSIVATIEAPSYNLMTMATDGPGKPSLLLNYKNIEKIYFRAYAFDIDARLKEKRNGSFLFMDNLQQQIKNGSQKLLLEWNETLQKTTDFAMHRALLTPKISKPGQYIIVAASRPDFSGTSDQVVAVQMTITDLFMLTTNKSDGEIEARILSALKGIPVKGAELELYRFQWNKTPEKSASWKSNSEGYALVKPAEKAPESSGEYWNYVLLGRKDSQVITQPEGLYFYKSSPQTAVTGAFVFTDRSIYRPQQKILWKAVLYSGDSGKGQFQTAKAGTAFSIQLLDPNGEVVAKKNGQVNQFGTSSGDFEIPSGRLLGSWRVMVNQTYHMSSNIRVEEYKRPTFEAVLKESLKETKSEPTAELKLNQKAKIFGEAKYYFGLPVSGGKVNWRITRQEVTPWWWSYWGGGFDFQFWRPGRLRQPQTVASGSSVVQADGSFEIEFLPEADPRLAQSEGISYNFNINADVTDEGGETRSAQKTLRLGYVSVEASLYWKKGFFSAGEAIEIESRRASLSGEARKGKGKFRVVSLIQPPTTPLPADLPVDLAQGRGGSEDESADLEKHGTADDKRRARWETTFSWPAVTRRWKEGSEIARGEVEHLVDNGADGRGKIIIPGIKDSGAYRIFYETKDESGAVFKVSRDFIVGSAKTNLALPFFFEAESRSVEVGQSAKFLLHSGFAEQNLTMDIYRSAKLIARRNIVVGKDPSIFEIPIKPEDRGGFSIYVYGVRDYQLFGQEVSISVPWTDKVLDVSFSTFRDKIRPGTPEKFTIKVKDFQGKALEKGGAELLAYMYDRSLDLFAPHFFAQVQSVYPGRIGVPGYTDSLRQNMASYLWGHFDSIPSRPSLWGDRLNFYPGYGVGGPGSRRGYRGIGDFDDRESESRLMPMAAAPAGEAVLQEKAKKSELSSANASAEGKLADSASISKDKSSNKIQKEADGSASDPGQEIRSQFSETAFFEPHLILGSDSSVSFEFKVPDSVTSWKVFAHALTKDFRGGSVQKTTESVKELMVRPYIPRFLREGDAAEIKVLVNNASEDEISGDLSFDIEDLETGKSVLAEFGLTADQKNEKKSDPKSALKAAQKSEMWQRAFKVAKKGSTTLTFPVKAPRRVGLFAVRVLAKSKNYSDGELRPIPVLPSRMRLAQSRFVTLKNNSKKTMEFPDLAAAAISGVDPTLQNEKMVVTIDGQLFYSVLQSLPYLIKYPYECIEQTMNRFLSTGIVSSVFKKFPAVAEMAKEFSQRKTAVEKFDAPDANQRMQLEESPWLGLAKGGKVKEEDLVNVLDSRLAAGERDRALQQIEKMQLPSGAWPWFPGGPPDQYMTLYVLMGFSRALEFKMEVPKPIAVKAWTYLKSWLDSELQNMMSLGCCHETITYLNFVLSSYPDESWTGGLFNEAYRRQLLDYSFSAWKSHSPLLKGYLALTLHRMKRAADAKLVWDAVLDSAKNTDELGTYWAPESRSWLWYNDTVETQAFALRTLMELDPANKLNEGLVQWLFLNKKLNHWKSTKATAEAIYSLVHYLDKNAALGAREVVKVDWGTQKTEFIFEPNKYTGKKNQIVLEADRIDPKIHSKVVVEKQTPGFAFASAVWHFSTEKLPTAERGDFFNVSRKYFKRQMKAGQWTLTPLTEGTVLQVGDQIEVQISLSTKHEAEYVHLRDPRAAGMEPESLVSGYKSDLGIFWYEEIRDSGENFFFSRLPVGEYNFRYRLRANMAGQFRVGPATVQSIYAPEFNAYSKGDMITIK